MLKIKSKNEKRKKKTLQTTYTGANGACIASEITSGTCGPQVGYSYPYSVRGIISYLHSCVRMKDDREKVLRRTELLVDAPDDEADCERG